MTYPLNTPNLETTPPKTITAIGRFSSNLNLPKIFDILPLFDSDDFKAITYKHEGLKRESEDGGIVKESDTEFKNSITMEILDKECEKTRSVKIHCAGVHMCGNRSIKRARKMAELIVETISRTNEFIDFCKQGTSWDEIADHGYFRNMLPVINSILPSGTTTTTLSDELKDKVKHFFRNIRDSGGLFEKKNLTLESLDTVMINFSYNIENYLKENFKTYTKEQFLKNFIECANEHPQDKFDIFINYDNLSSSMGWSGSVPLKFVHRETQLDQWLTLQMRRGTIINSGPTFEVMQEAVNVLYDILGVLARRDTIVNID